MSAIPYAIFKKDFKWEKHIGKGSCAQVNQYYHAISKQSYAVKRIELKSHDDFVQAINEIEVIRLIDDEKATKVYYFYSLPAKQIGNSQLGIVMELCKESLADVIKLRKSKRQYFKKQDLRTLLNVLVPFFTKMQNKGILHRDIKPDNILLANTKKIDYRVADFGFAIKQNEYTYRNVAGTVQYVSPKLLVKFKNHNASVPAHNIKDDVYSFGKTIGEYMTLDPNWMQNPNAIKECNDRYGKEYSLVIVLATKNKESERADFSQLQQYLISKKLMDYSENEFCRTSYSLDRTRLSFSSVGENTTNRYDSLQKTKKNVKETRGLVLNRSKTKRKQSPQHTQSNLPIQCKRQKSSLSQNELQEWKKKVIQIKDQVNCLQIYENLMFLGMQEKLGIMITASSKLIRVSYINILKEIHCLKVFQENQMLILGTLQGRVFCIPILELKRLMISNNQNLKTKNTIDVSLQGLKFKEYILGLPVSTFDIISSNLKSVEPTLVLGHFTGELTVISCNKVQRKMSFCSQPVTHIEVREGMLYTSTAYGLFKRQSTLSLGLQSEDQNVQCKGKDVFKGMYNNQIYNCKQAIMSFRIISNCKKNASIKKEEYKYLALLFCWNGMINILSKSMRCEIAVRITESNITGCFFVTQPHRQLGVYGLAVDDEGTLVDIDGKVISQTEEKNLVSVISDGESIFCGGHNKKVVCLTAIHSLVNLQ